MKLYLKKNAQISSFVGHKKLYRGIPITDITKDNDSICLTCNKRHKITQDKSMNKNEIIDWFTKYLVENKEHFTLDWLRGQKLSFESVYEMRKEIKR